MAEKYNRTFKDYLFQALLIIFSVLFALLINRYTENLKIKKQKNIAWSGIQQELANNHAILLDWKQRHEDVLHRINELAKLPDDSLKEKFFLTGSFNFGVMTDNKSLLDEIMTNTAWETARSTGIISEFDYNDVERLTKIYALQDNIINYTLLAIIDLLHDRTSQNPEDIRVTLLLFRSLFSELLGQEILLLQLYEQLPDFGK
jgi:hypothetical protein